MRLIVNYIDTDEIIAYNYNDLSKAQQKKLNKDKDLEIYMYHAITLTSGITVKLVDFGRTVAVEHNNCIYTVNNLDTLYGLQEFGVIDTLTKIEMNTVIDYLRMCIVNELAFNIYDKE